MRFPPLVGLLACFSLAAVSDATAAPAGGGLYEGDVLLPQASDGEGRSQSACRGCISLIVANDGLSLDGGYLSFGVPCAGGEGVPGSYHVQEWPSATTQIDATGAFLWSSQMSDEDNLTVAGQFTADGSHAEGRISYVGQADGPCVARDVPFRAALTGRPARSHPGRSTACGAVPGRNGDVITHERGVGCTRAKALELAWAHDSVCRKNPSGLSCRVEGFDCSGVHGGRFSHQASVRCGISIPRAGAVELVMEADCGYVKSARLNLTAVNTSCRSARRMGVRMPQGCGFDQGFDQVGQLCRAGRYRCRVTELSGDSTIGRCFRRDDAFFAVLFEYVWPL